jgi:hypothetical protein
MAKLILMISLVVSLSGCSFLEPRIEYRDKLVPVYTVPAPPEIERPELPIHSPRYQDIAFLSNPNNIGQIVQDYTVSLRLVLNYSLAQEEIIETYRRLSRQDFANQPLLRSMSNGSGEGVPELFAGTRFDNPTEAAIYSQAEFETYARFAFEDVVDKYEERKEEILNNETE